MWWWLFDQPSPTCNYKLGVAAAELHRILAAFSSILKMGRSTHALLFLLFLLCSAAMAVSTKDMFGEDLGLSLATREENHKHSGFSQAECPGACQFRCSKTAYKKPCMFFCQKCCFKCKCVPPGTYAHKEVCPCYNNWKTKRGGPKCP